MRTKFTSHGETDITIEYDEVMSDLRQCRTFTLRGSYIYELLSADRSQQVCRALALRGDTLMASSKTFQAVIRREFKKRIALDKKFFNA